MLKPCHRTLIYSLLFVSLTIFFFITGGLVVTILEERVEPATSLIVWLCAGSLAALFSTAFCMQRLSSMTNATMAGFAAVRSRQRRYILFNTVLFLLLVGGTLILCNIAASFFSVPWPMSGLHGVSPETGRKAWGYHEKTAGFVPVNSWGQRDREHAVKPYPGTHRVVFIGDSFLEDGAPVPLPSRTEETLRAMGETSIEVINLGVSATDPDEYFFRLKRIGLPMQPDHCVLMFSAGSDFIQAPSLLSFWGISAPYPRLSFLQRIGLRSLDHVISNERRPILRAWFKGGSLLKHELELQEIFAKTRNDAETEAEYLSFFPPEEQQLLKSVLNSASASERRTFYEMLRHPDHGLFRSNYLDIATKVAKGLKVPADRSTDHAFRWIKAASDLCRKKGVRFTLVIIPDGFSVDTRMVKHYAPLADMKAYMQHLDNAANLLYRQAAEAGIEVVDLHGVLKAQPGAYLNMDGHWSQQGVDLVAAHLAKNYISLSVARGKQ